MTFRRHFATCLLALWMAGAICLSVPGADPQAAVEDGRQALSGGILSSDHPWYDSEEDRARLIPIEPKTTVHTSWLRALGDWIAGLFSWISDLFSWMSGIDFNFFGLITLSLLDIFLILVGIVVTALLIFFLVKLYRRSTQSADDKAGPAEREEEADRGRVESLPFELQRPRGNLLDEARARYEQGQYNEAVVYLFSYLLVQLDKSHAIRLAKGKTNRQYVRELAERKPLRAILEQAMWMFEDAFFGKYSIERERFEKCWRRLGEFHDHLQEGTLA